MRHAVLAMFAITGCARTECTPPDYSRSECRAQAEYQLAQGSSADGVEFRFQDPLTTSTDGTQTRGLVSSDLSGRLVARVASLGDFRISVHRGDAQVDTIAFDVTNVHPLTETLLGEVSREGLTRHLLLPLLEDVVEIRGTLPPSACESGFTLAAVGDIQTGPMTFEDIVQDLHREASYADGTGKPLLGMLLLGDLAEFGTQQELTRVAQMLAASPVPVAVTAGNHDIYATVQPFFNATFGPGNYAFDLCNARVVMLDTGNADIAESIQARLPELLDTDLRFLVAGTHYPPYAAQTADGWRREDQAQHLLAELASREADLIFAGHVHFRGTFDAAPVSEVIVGTGGASQRKIDPDYGYLRAVFGETLERCFVSLPVPGSLGTIVGDDPPNCAANTVVR